MKTLIDESDYMDAVLNGGGWREKYADQHQMRSRGQPVADAQRKAEGWIAASLGKAAQKRASFDARNPLLSGGITVGLKNFGQALHTITDGFSPAHAGFQIWFRPGLRLLDPGYAAQYGRYIAEYRAQESLDVLLSDAARLEKIIKAARDAFFETFGQNACDCAN